MIKSNIALVKILTVTLLLLVSSKVIFSQTPLSGTYTIDPSGNGDYSSFTLAVADLDSFGVSGPTVFEAVNGVYVESIIISPYLGTSSTNTVKFTSQTGNANSVSLSYSSTNYSNNYVVRINGASNIILENLTITSLDTSFSDVISVWGADNLEINQCIIVGDSATCNDDPVTAFGVVNNLTITNCTIYGGVRNIFCYGWSQYSQNVIIEGNTLLGAFNTAVQVSWSNNLVVVKNYISMNVNAQTISGFFGYKINGGKIQFNHVVGSENGPSQGLSIQNSKGTSTNFFDISDNRLFLPFLTEAIYPDDNKNIRYSHNSIYGETNSYVGYRTGFHSRFDTNVSIRDNIIQVIDNGLGIWVESSVSVSSDYNNVSTPGGYIGRLGSFLSVNYSTLSAWQTATGQDSNSLTVNNIFIDTTNLLVCTDSLYGKGDYIPAYSVDFEGDVRQNPPCIGADEFFPAPDLSMISDTVLCDGDTLNYLFDADTVVWNSTDTVNNYDVTNTGAQSVVVYGRCGFDSASFDVFPQQYADINDTNLCDGEVAFYDCGILNGTYQWSNGSNGQITLINSAQTLIVNVIDSSGCASSDVAIITQSTDVDLPDSAIFCSGNNVILDADVPSSYLWNTGSTQQTISVTSNGLYSVTVTDLNCVSIDSTYVYEVFNTIPSFTDSSDFFTVWFTNTSQNADSYLWDFGDGITPTDINPVHVYPVSSQNVELYTVTLTADNSCGDNEIINDGVRVGQLVSVSEIELASMISVYPNPNNGVFTVVLKSVNFANVKIEVVDVLGAIVSTANLGTIQGGFSQEINLNDAAPGIYFVRVILNKESAVYRIVVE